MANSLTYNASVTANVNGLSIATNGSNTLSPTGSIVLGESVAINTGSYQLVTTGSLQNIAIISAFNSNPSSSVNLAVSASGVVSNLGTLPPYVSNNTPSVISWGQPFTGLYAQAVSQQSYVVFVVSTT